LRQLGLLAYFDCIKSSDDVEKVKPDPALYLKAAGCLGVEPEQCLVFEDSPNGSLAAKRAGMACVVVPNRVTKDLKFGEIDHRLGSMAETPLEEVIRFIESR
jgi:beta-phosphoglucomutase-like phosphatase (HAD superfamily)